MDPFSRARRLFLKRLSRYGASLALLGCTRSAIADSKTALTGIRVSQSSDEHTRIVFDLTGGIEHRLFTLDDPHRVVVDLNNTRRGRAIEISKKTTLH